MHYFVGILLIVIGPLMTIYYEKMYQMIGEVSFAEKYLGTGSSRFYYQLLGALVGLLGMIILFNLHEGLIKWLFGGLFGN